MDAIEQAIVNMIRKDLTDGQILDLVRDRLSANGPLKREVPKKAKEPRRAPKRLRAKNKKATPVKTPTLVALNPNEKKALKAIQASRTDLTVAAIAKKLRIKPDTARTALHSLTKKGLIERKGEGGGNKRPRRYVFGKV